jgi:hypothetical protein
MRARSRIIGLSFWQAPIPDRAAPGNGGANLRDALAEGVLREFGTHGAVLFGPEPSRAHSLFRVDHQFSREQLALASPREMRSAICRSYAPQLMRGAVEGLPARAPEQAHDGASRRGNWRRSAPLLRSCLPRFCSIPLGAVRFVSYLLVVLFVPVIAIRLLALCDLAFGRHSPAEHRQARIPDADLPIYTVLVALYREAKVLPALVDGLTKLDYPAAKLDIKLVLEASDADTIAAASALILPGNVEIVVVPDCEPRTKPKALNYALPMARGEYLVIFDAEDRPERDQLRKALAAFREGPPNLACVQGRLNLYNARENWLTRHFTIEYTALFDGLLPALDRMGLPFPLGGTSNHFRGIR